MNDTDKSTGGAFVGEQRSIETAKWLEHPLRITEHSWPEGTMPVVSINCITYNHEGYIRDAIEGFLMQETTFPVEILIHDDASTDRTAEILREYESRYPHLIKPIYQVKNQYSQGIRPFLLNLDRALGRYIAFCEGDDYWTFPRKLNEQILFLESHSDFSICFHRADIVLIGTSVPAAIEYAGPTDFGLLDYVLPHENNIRLNTLSIVMRREPLYQWDVIRKLGRKKINLDHSIICLSLSSGRAFVFDEVMGVYRRHSGGLSLLFDKHSWLRSRTWTILALVIYAKLTMLLRFRLLVKLESLYDLRGILRRRMRSLLGYLRRRC